ncbi:putative vacuolar ATP synthase 16 kDa proteolipid subunit [Dactylonectria estremocensis]|uniref:V-type proton ATPase proteolipid subunit n=2 Tax=Dactylonectria TaxID=1620264 RepID=A0A9P9J9V1_9HYPO|nr:putative vacuolar ATP synthase 16 kDa proteolipid subunit [Dactylonectria estremocensis]
MTVYPNPRVGLGNVSSLSRPVQQNLAANQTPAWNETLTSTPHKYPNSTIDGLSPDDSCQPALCRQLFVASPASISPAASSLQSQLVNTATMVSEYCPVYAPFFGAMGCTCAIVFTCLGASYGTAKSGVGIAAMGVLRPDLIVKNIVPVIMAGIIGIYGLVVSVLISDGLKQDLPLYTGFIQFGAGLSVGLAGLAAGFAIGIVGDAGVRGTAQQPRLFVGMILILIFAEVLGLYGLIVALLMNSKATLNATCD